MTLSACSEATTRSILTFGHKAECILGAAVNLRVSLLLTESLDLSHGQALHAESVSAVRPSWSFNGWTRILAVSSLMAYRPFPDAWPGSDNADDASNS